MAKKKNNLKNIKVKTNEEKTNAFCELVESLIAEGFDVALFEGQSEIQLYFPEKMCSLGLYRNGTWKLE